jgi:hypothetical protein
MDEGGDGATDQPMDEGGGGATTESTTTTSGPVGITVTADDGSEQVTVPRLTPDVSSGNGSVINTPATTAPATDNSGVATTSATVAGEGTAAIEALLENRLGTASVTVEDPTYGISGVSLVPSTVDANTTVEHNLQYTVDAASNNGNSDIHTVTLPNTTSITGATINNVTDADGDEIAVSSSASLSDANGGSNNQLTFGIQPDSSFDTSAVSVDANVTVEFPDVSADTTADIGIEVSDSAQGTTNATTPVTIRAAAPGAANFTVSNVSPDGVNVTAGDNVTVTADVENVGDAAGTQTVEFRLDTDQNGTLESDETVESAEVSLDAGNSTTVTFENVSTDDLSAGDYTHGVFSANDSATATITVEAADDGGVPQNLQRFANENGEIGNLEVLNAVNAANAGNEIGGEPVDNLDVLQLVNYVTAD